MNRFLLYTCGLKVMKFLIKTSQMTGTQKAEMMLKIEANEIVPMKCKLMTVLYLWDDKPLALVYAYSSWFLEMLCVVVAKGCTNNCDVTWLRSVYYFFRTQVPSKRGGQLTH